MWKINYIYAFLGFISLLLTAQLSAKTQDLSAQLTFNNEINLLNEHYSPIVLSRGKQKVLVLPELQGRVMSSTSKGGGEKGYGWFNYDYLSKPHTNTNASMGGADRLWFGPDGSKFSLFFEPKTKTIPENIKVPAAVSMIPFDVISQSNEKVVVSKALSMRNYQGFNFEFEVKREIQLLSKKHLPVTVPEHLNWVGYKALTKVINTSEQAWLKSTGLFSIWDLGTFYPSDNTTVLIPLAKPLTEATRYFSDVTNSHTRIKNEVVYYKADAKYMNKIGIPPSHTKPIFGSYDENRKLLTLVLFSLTSEPDVDYVNSIWRFKGEAFNGEIINVFNHGLNEEGKPLGPFYELETSSIALALKPNESYQHYQTTFHLQGDEASLSLVTQEVFGVSIAEIKSVF